MVAVATFRLPGVYFLSAPRPAPVALPPLDIAGFVGFAMRGPLDTSVPVEDLATFDAIFGGPFMVARDPAGKPMLAYLRDAVATFFSSGGRRCYVVRVAGPEAAPARFTLPTMAAINAAAGIGRVACFASAPGTWGNALRLSTSLTATPLPKAAFTVLDATRLSWRTRGAPQAIRPGDLLRIRFEMGGQWLFPVAAVNPLGPEDTPTAILVARTLWPIQQNLAGSLPTAVSAVSQLTSGGPVPIGSGALGAVGEEISLSMANPGNRSVVRGDMLVLDLADGSRYVLTVAATQARLAVGSPPNSTLTVSATELLCLRDSSGQPPALPLPPARITRIVRLHLSLAIKYGDATAREIGSLGFNAPHPRFWGDIAVAESGSLAGGAATASTTTQRQVNTLAPGAATALYRQLFGTTRADLDWTDPSLTTVVSTLLAPVPGDDMLFLPVGMPSILTDGDLVGADARTADDKLPIFASGPFLDPHLAGATSSALPPVRGTLAPSTLLSAAIDLYFLQDIKLKGIHSLMFVDEVALIAVPDAIQLGWQSPPVPIPSPSSTTATPPQRATFGVCPLPPALLSITPGSGTVAGGTSVTITATDFRFTASSEVTVVFDRRNATSVTIVDDDTLTCLTPPAASAGPVTVKVTDDAGSSSLSAGFNYVADPTEAILPTTINAGSYEAATLPLLYQIQTSLIRLCEARGDAVAILALPAHFETQNCVAWLQGLREGLGLPRHGAAFADVRVIADLSYAAVYHPWLLVPDPDGPLGVLRPVPPDGAACGSIADRELDRGVWIAPANVALPGVLDLQPDFTEDEWATLFASGFNLPRGEARDFRIMSAHTLADDQSLLQLSVRRLMIQLRKAALLQGQDDVFGKNDELFRHRLRSRFEDLLRYMFERGAFAGSTRDTSYRIAVDGTVNTRADFDEGRVIAQILVAPSQPMEFLTVLLTRSGDGQLQTAEG
jgi:hypothetical protein